MLFSEEKNTMVNPPKDYKAPEVKEVSEVPEAVSGDEGESQPVPPSPVTAPEEEGVTSEEVAVGESQPSSPGHGAPHDELY
jgi:hypothetical protein